MKVIFMYGAQTLESLEVVLKALYLTNVSDSRIGEKNMIQSFN